MAAIPLLALGLINLGRSEFMPYHADAVGRPWAQVEPASQILIIALMRSFGGTALALGIAVVVIVASSVLSLPGKAGDHG